MTRVAVLGLGEAGRAFAARLAAHAHVVGWDPLVTEPGTGADGDHSADRLDRVAFASSAADAVAEADAVVAFTTAAHSADALASTLAAAAPGTVHADFATAAPAAKAELAARAHARGIRFVDAAIMAPVRRGAGRTPLLLSGEGAGDLAALLERSGYPVEVLDGAAGSSAARKLLRSMLVKGLTGVMIESLRAAEREGLDDWFADHLIDTLTGLDREFLSGLLDGTARHSARRIDELDAAAAMTEHRGGRAHVTRAVAEVLRSVADEGVPHGGTL